VLGVPSELLQLEEAELQTLYSSFMSNIRLFGMMLDNSASVGVYSVVE
jgi:hypothetical protein